ncbi:unnamed protein product [Linum trigynum]|uniref:Uncharacterized protein n=1 Tax=Linum trigynum TaxID=586398 RepID=A0AAV2CX96_9ROSI
MQAQTYIPQPRHRNQNSGAAIPQASLVTQCRQSPRGFKVSRSPKILLGRSHNAAMPRDHVDDVCIGHAPMRRIKREKWVDVEPEEC